VWWLVRVRGIEGVAIAWSGRFAVDTFLMFWATLRMGNWVWGASALRTVGAVVGVCACATLVHTMSLGAWAKAGIVAGMMVSFYSIVWTSVLRGDERQWVFQLAAQLRRQPASRQA
jgi:hypothetical protein